MCYELVHIRMMRRGLSSTNTLKWSKIVNAAYHATEKVSIMKT